MWTEKRLRLTLARRVPPLMTASSGRTSTQVVDVSHAPAYRCVAQRLSAGREEPPKQSALAELFQPDSPALNNTPQPIKDPVQLCGDLSLSLRGEPPGVIDAMEITRYCSRTNLSTFCSASSPVAAMADGRRANSSPNFTPSTCSTIRHSASKLVENVGGKEPKETS
jgi:hypothetical protein